MIQLQIAVDTFSIDQVLRVADEVCDIADILEIGTPVIVREGVRAVRMVKDRHPGLTVLADTKIIDGGAMESQDACEAGADIVTVLALADDSTIRAVVETAHSRGRRVTADLICVENIAERAEELVALGVDYVCVHTATDVQGRGVTPLGQLRELVRAIPPEKAVAAGGISCETLSDYLAERPAIVIMGSSVCKSPDVRAAAAKAKRLILEADRQDPPAPQ